MEHARVGIDKSAFGRIVTAGEVRDQRPQISEMRRSYPPMGCRFSMPYKIHGTPPSAFSGGTAERSPLRSD